MPETRIEPYPVYLGADDDGNLRVKITPYIYNYMGVNSEDRTSVRKILNSKKQSGKIWEILKRQKILTREDIKIEFDFDQ